MKDKLRSLFLLINEVSDWLSSDPMVKAVAPSELYSLIDSYQEDLIREKLRQ